MIQVYGSATFTQHERDAVDAGGNVAHASEPATGEPAQPATVELVHELGRRERELLQLLQVGQGYLLETRSGSGSLAGRRELARLQLGGRAAGRRGVAPGPRPHLAQQVRREGGRSRCYTN